MNEQNTALIAMTQLPEIRENLRALRECWEQEAKDAAALVCTDESIQSIKKMRAEMRKEFDSADEQRKAVKDRYMAAWMDVESTWKECVAEPFKRADASYKATIDSFEDELKARCREGLQAYFDEACAVLGVDFLTLDQAMGLAGVKITMADAKAKTPQKLMDAVAKVVYGLADDMEVIEGMPEEDRAEIMAEFKVRFDVGDAIATVNARKRRVKAEQEAAEARRIAQERFKEAARKVEAVVPPVPVEAPREPEKVFEKFSFTVHNVTKSQLIKLRDYLKQEGIQYE